MKKTILTTLIAAGISTAPLANELAKLNFVTENAAQAPAQKVAIQEKVAVKTASQTAQELDTIPELIFDSSNFDQLAVLTPIEMAETEGSFTTAQLAGLGAMTNLAQYSLVYRIDNGKWPHPVNAAGAAAIGAVSGAQAGLYQGISGYLRAATSATIMNMINAGVD